MVLLCLAAVTTVVALSQRRQEQGQQAQLLSHTLATRALALGTDQRGLSRLLAVLALRQASTEESRSAVLAQQAPRYVTQIAADENSAQAMAVSADGHTLALGNTDGTTTICTGPTSLWDMNQDNGPFASGDFAECTATPWARAGIPPTTVPGSGTPVTAVALTNDGHTLAVGRGDGTITLMSLGHRKNATPIGEITNVNDFPQLGGPLEWVDAVALTPDGRALAVRNSPGITFMCESPVTLTVRADTGCPTSFWIDGQSNAGVTYYLVYALSISADGRVLVVGRSDGIITLWDLARHKTIATFDQPGIPASVALSPDGHTLAVATAGTIHLWDVPVRGEIATIDTAGISVESMAFSPDGHTLLTATPAGVTLWDVDTNHVATTLCGAIPVLTPGQWAHLIPELPFGPPCRGN